MDEFPGLSSASDSKGEAGSLTGVRNETATVDGSSFEKEEEKILTVKRRHRGAQRGATTRIMNAVREVIQYAGYSERMGILEEIEKKRLIVGRNSLEKKLKELERKNEEILEIMIDGKDEDEIQREIEGADEYDMEIQVTISSIDSAIANSEANQKRLGARGHSAVAECGPRDAESTRSTKSKFQSKPQTERSLIDTYVTTDEEKCEHVQRTEEESENNEEKLSTSMIVTTDEPLKQMRKISIPVFCGDKQAYPSWRATFMACVGDTSAKPELKILHLHQYLRGEALTTIESLGFTSLAYQTAIGRLDRKYGGSRRRIAITLEEIEAFPPMRNPKPATLQKFTDLLEVAIVNFRENQREQELNDGVFYNKLLSKMNTQLITQYNRWKTEKGKAPGVETLHEFIQNEAEFATEAIETVEGVCKQTSGLHQHAYGSKESSRAHSYYCQQSIGSRHSPHARSESYKCSECGQNGHGLWRCQQFKEADLSHRWDIVKKFKLCFKCLGEGHMKHNCPRSLKSCGIPRCKNENHTLLHDHGRKYHRTDGRNAVATETATNDQGETTLCQT